MCCPSASPCCQNFLKGLRHVIEAAALSDLRQCCSVQWTGKDDEVARAAGDKMQSMGDQAHRKGREIKDSWSR